jgi:hypothetical protein
MRPRRRSATASVRDSSRCQVARKIRPTTCRSMEPASLGQAAAGDDGDGLGPAPASSGAAGRQAVHELVARSRSCGRELSQPMSTRLMPRDEDQERTLGVLVFDEAVGKTPGDRLRAVLDPH